MTRKNNLTSVANEEIVDACAAFGAELHDRILLAILTGSFLRKLHDRPNPNVNIYFFATQERACEVRLKLARFLESRAQHLEERKIGLRIDCHPYIVTRDRETPDRVGCITLTTKVLECSKDAARFNLPPTIGHSWGISCRVLHGNPAIINELAQIPATPAEWLSSSHEALVRYKGIIDHLPMLATPEAQPVFLAKESIFYAREALRDLVAIATPFEGLDYAEHFVWLNSKREKELFKTLGWGDVVQVSDAVDAWHKALVDGRRPTPQEARGAWELANETWQIAWKKYSARAKATLGEDMPWLLRVNAFV